MIGILILNLIHTGWYVSPPHKSQEYVATTIIGFTSVLLITIPRTEINLPMLLAFTSRIGSSFLVLRSLKYISLKQQTNEVKIENL